MEAHGRSWDQLWNSEIAGWLEVPKAVVSRVVPKPPNIRALT